MSASQPESASSTTSTPKHFPDLQTLTIPFQVPNRSPCTATITIEPCQDTHRHGVDLIDLYPDDLVPKGFPVLNGTISSPESRTYAAIYGWIQLTSVPTEDWIMDIYPPFQDLNNPYCMWGAVPNMVDTPNRDLTDPKWNGYNWSARTFLTYDAKAAMERVVVPIFAFEWGFHIQDGKALVKELRRIDVSNHVKIAEVNRTSTEAGVRHRWLGTGSRRLTSPSWRCLWPT